MAPLDETLDKAIRARASALRERREREVWILAAAASYAVDALFLGLFAAAGTIPVSLPLWYGASAALLSAGFYFATSSGWSERLQDAGMVSWQSLAGLVLQIGVVAHAPQIAFPFLVNLFTVFAFGMIWIPVARSVVLWLLGAALTGAVLVLHADRLGVPAATGAQLALTWLFFSLVLGRCVFLSVYAASMRDRVARSRRRLAESMEQIQSLVSHDELTKTLNRRALLARLEQEASRAARSGQAFSVALLDLDHFKAVNDTCGHAAGDEVLRQFARTVHATMRQTDVFGRYGGEEFMMILLATPPATAAAALERVCSAVREHDWSPIGPALAVTVSAGVADFRAGETVGETLKRADAALYAAKRAGRDRVLVA